MTAVQNGVFFFPMSHPRRHHTLFLRIVGGAIGVLLILGSALAQVDLATPWRIGIGLLGLGMVLTAAFASDKNVERWFGGL